MKSIEAIEREMGARCQRHPNGRTITTACRKCGSQFGSFTDFSQILGQDVCPTCEREMQDKALKNVEKERKDRNKPKKKVDKKKDEHDFVREPRGRSVH